MESIGSSLGIDRELIWAGLDWSGPDIRPGLNNRQGKNSNEDNNDVRERLEVKARKLNSIIFFSLSLVLETGSGRAVE